MKSVKSNYHPRTNLRAANVLIGCGQLIELKNGVVVKCPEMDEPELGQVFCSNLRRRREHNGEGWHGILYEPVNSYEPVLVRGDNWSWLQKLARTKQMWRILVNSMQAVNLALAEDTEEAAAKFLKMWDDFIFRGLESGIHPSRFPIDTSEFDDILMELKNDCEVVNHPDKRLVATRLSNEDLVLAEVPNTVFPNYHELILHWLRSQKLRQMETTPI